MNRPLTAMLAASFLVASCEGETGRKDNVLRVALEARPLSLDPRQSTDAASGRIGEILFSRLVKPDERMAIVPDLATSWDVAADGLTYRFHLRPGVRFHDGSLLEAEDVAFTFRTILAPSSDSPKRQSYQMIERIEVQDPMTVVFHLREPNAPFLTNMILGILPSEADADLARTQLTPIGSGPFRIVENDNGSFLRLEAFDGYFEGRPPLDGIIFRHIADPALRVLELQKGTIDLIQNDLIPEFVPALRKQPGLKVVSEPGVNCSYVGMNLRHPALSRLEVRQAIGHAIDRGTISELLLRDTATLAESILAPTNWAYDPELRGPAHDPGLARTLLDAAGFPDPDGPGPAPRLSLNYKTSVDKLRLRIAEVIRRNLLEVGIAVKIQSYEFATFFADVKKGNFDLFSLTWVGITDPDILYSIFHSSSFPPDGSNRVFYSNPVVDRLLEQGRAELSTERRAAAYREVQRHVLRDLALLPLWYTNNVACMRSDVEGFELYPAGNYYSLARVRFSPRAEALP